MELFRKSGLSIDVLKQIWLLADKDTDGSLTSKEFCVAWHLIVCVSKKGLPLPKYLPDSVRAALFAKYGDLSQVRGDPADVEGCAQQ